MSNIHGLITKVPIKADAQGNAPATIELLRVGNWDTPWHGSFEITMGDLHEFVVNFGKGIGLVEGDVKIPLNYAHESWDKAAGWIVSLSVDETRQALVGSVEWTPNGEQALKDKEWSYISPEFNPRGCPWEDPEGGEDGIPVFVNNVITGAALTNIPLFKKLKPIMASRVPSKKKKADATSGNGDKSTNQGEPMKLEDILAKQVSDRSDEEKAFLSEHAADLSDEQKTQLDTEASDAEAQAQADKEAAEKAEQEKADADAKAAEEEAAKVEASKGKGVQISADRLAKLEADAKAGREAQETLRRKEADDLVSTAVKAGQVKSGDKDKWVNQLLAARGDNRKELESLLAGLPKKEDLGEELGGAGVEASAGAHDELHTKVTEAIKASAEKGKTLKYSEARKQVLSADADLKKRVKEEEEN